MNWKNFSKKIGKNSNPFKKVFSLYFKNSLLINIMLLALVIRIAFFYFIEKNPLITTPVQEENLIMAISEKIRNGEPIGNFWLSQPALPILVNFGKKILGNFELWIIVVRILLATSSLILVYWLAKKIFNKKIGLLAVFWLIFFSPWLIVNFRLLPFMFLSFLILLVLNIIAYEYPRKDFIRYPVIGALLLLFMLFDFIYFFPALIAIIMIFAYEEGKLTEKFSNGVFAIAGAGLLFFYLSFFVIPKYFSEEQTMLPAWTVRIMEYNRTEKPIFPSVDTPLKEKIEIYEAMANKKIEKEGKKISPTAFYVNRLNQEVKNYPWENIKKNAAKLALIFNKFNESENYNGGQYAKVVPYFNYLPNFNWISTLGLLGIFFAWHKKGQTNEERKLLKILTAAFVLSLFPALIIFPFAEYKIIPFIFLAIFSSFFIFYLFNFIKKFKKKPAPLVYLALAIISLAYFSNKNIASTPFGNEAAFLNFIAKEKIEDEKFTDAENLLLTAEASQPAYIATYQNLYKLYLINGNYISAKKNLSKKILLDPNNEWNYLALKNYHQLEEKTLEDARKVYLEKSEISQAKEFILDLDYYEALGFLEEKNISRAEEELESLARTDFKKKEFIFFRIGIANLLNGNLKKAENFFQKSVEINPYLLPAWYNLAQISTEDEKYEKANEQLLAIYKELPDYGNVIYLIADNYLKLEKEKEALPFMKEFIEKNRNNPQVKKEVEFFEGKVMVLEREMKEEEAEEEEEGKLVD